MDEPLYPNVRDSREVTDNIIVPAYQRPEWDRCAIGPDARYTCVGCGENIGHGHLLTDCLKVLRARVESLETRVLELEPK